MQILKQAIFCGVIVYLMNIYGMGHSITRSAIVTLATVAVGVIGMLIWKNLSATQSP
jgi:hypothetical protein